MAYVEGARAPVLAMDRAAAVLAAARGRAIDRYVPVNVAVLDAAGHLKAFTRMDGDGLGSTDLAIRQARTAGLVGTPSAAVWSSSKPDAPAPGRERSGGGLRAQSVRAERGAHGPRPKGTGR